ncbi:metallophosphoesterase [Aestuariivivens sediminis]|uniref:metallophosphoesterase n=1 Tax=Aestuariivivens sediminis TaxID=2913557 RepID=UPI001F5969D3|nr:metallophosphoesterase [Aestuariivivens sediminis]
MRTFVVGDIHGGLKALVQVLNALELKHGDTLIFVGDYVDGWSESAQVIQFLMERSQKMNCIFIKGNHDVWCEAWLRDGEVSPVWYMHGGKETMESYALFTEDQKQQHLTFFENLKPYHIDEANRLFLHAGFTSMHGVEKEVFQSVLYFDRTLWEMALTMDEGIEKDSKLYPNRLKHYHEIYIGHTPTLNYGVTVPMHAVNVWNIDTGAAFTGKLSAMDIDTKAIVQSSPLPDLYPNEKGRNRD